MTDASPSHFAPIAIIGSGCVAPNGAHSPEALWELFRNGSDATSSCPEGRWRLPRADVAAEALSDRGGYVRGFDAVFDPEGFHVPAHEVRGFDAGTQWLLHAGREALRSAGRLGRLGGMRVGAIVGNLSFPTDALARFTEREWLALQASPFLRDRAGDLARITRPDATQRFSSGMPAMLLAQALGLNLASFALDAACASSLYAIKLACDRLHDGRADMMLAGAVCGSDDLFIHVGFTALQALSRVGQSRPFHRDADGLLPAEGAAIFALRRLDDAIHAGDTILGVIRGVGLSNDGRSSGLLVPSKTGQVRAIRAALSQSGLAPRDVSLLECHATGTPLGDATELASSAIAYEGATDLPIGSAKSNFGHALTTAGSFGLLKVLGAMREAIRPPTLHTEAPIDALRETPFRLVREAEAWRVDGLRRAGISAFGFGGNNAHLLVEEWRPRPAARASGIATHAPPREPIAIVAVGACVADGRDRHEFAKALFTQTSRVRERPGSTPAAYTDDVSLPLQGLRFPPADLAQTLPQQLLVLRAANEAVGTVAALPTERTGVYVGMQCDPTIARGGVRERLREWTRAWAQAGHALPERWVDEARAAVGGPLTSAGVVGKMPNIVTNRINRQFDLAGPSFSVSSEESSGLDALDVAVRALRHEEIDAALVGAVDLSCEPVHEAAAREVLTADKQTPGDAAVTLVLKRLADARRDGDTVWALVTDSEEDSKVSEETPEQTSLFGHPHAASGLLTVAVAALACRHRVTWSKAPGAPVVPWTSTVPSPARSARTRTTRGPERTVTLRVDRESEPASSYFEEIPRVHVYSGRDRREVLRRLDAGQRSNEGPARLSILATEAQLAARVAQARAFLESGAQPPKNLRFAEGIFFRERPLEGELAFVFTGPAGAYPHMGTDLVRAFPELIDRLVRLGAVDEETAWVYSNRPEAEITPGEKLWGSALLSQLHAGFTRGIVGLAPQVSIGFCSGETNALFAFDVWGDIAHLRDGIAREGVYDRALSGDFQIARDGWKARGLPEGQWETWRVAAPVEALRKALEGETDAHITIINAPGDVILGGRSEACARVLDRIGRERAGLLPYNMTIHCPEMRPFGPAWRRLHDRPTVAPKGVRFYTHATCASYELTQQSVADALTGQALGTVDFPKLVQRAYDDGVRVFVEHGPLGGCASWVRRTLGEREHLALPMDLRSESSLTQALRTVAELAAAGVSFDVDAFNARIARANATHAQRAEGPQLSWPAHAPMIRLPAADPVERAPAMPPLATPAPQPAAVTTARARGVDAPGLRHMAPAPWIPPVLDGTVPPPAPTHRAQRSEALAPYANEFEALDSYAASEVTTLETPYDEADETPMKTLLERFQEHAALLSQAHQHYVNTAEGAFRAFLTAGTAGTALEATPSALANTPGTLANSPSALANTPGALANTPSALANTPSALANTSGALANTSGALANTSGALANTPGALANSPSALERPFMATGNVATAPVRAETAIAASNGKRAAPVSSAERKRNEHLIPRERKTPKGPKYSREQLEVLASGKVSEVFGPLFAQQDDYPVQVRMPEPPLLLADRVTGIDAEPGVLGLGTIWTETDVRRDSWYLNGVYMPPGVMIESGQADLLLISWMGIDNFNKGERAYRLLGCELMYHGSPPKVGETLEYEITVDGHAAQGDIRLFFFHYDCRVNGELRMTVRGGQAGFFSKEDLRTSQGVLWTPDSVQLDPKARVDAPRVAAPRAYTKEQVDAFSEGRPWECFGPSHDLTQTHQHSPRIQSGKMRLFDNVLEFDPKGGPWGRGYLKARLKVTPDHWTMDGHFKNDPCMPGTLMCEAGFQLMSFYLTGLGYTLDRDAWRFEPVTGELFDLKCRGQVTPTTNEIIYELFVEEVHDGETPTVYADFVGTVDGLLAFHGRRVATRLVADWPLTVRQALLDSLVDERPCAVLDDGFPFDMKSIYAAAWGKPSHAFGPGAEQFVGMRRLARLPGPPYLFMSRVAKTTGPYLGMQTGSSALTEYDVPADEWYFRDNGARSMPWAVLLEAALQPCGWLSTYVGCPFKNPRNLKFRNLDGTATLHEEILPGPSRFDTDTKLTVLVVNGDMMIEGFDVKCFLDGRPVYDMVTRFGHFPPEALEFENQVGLPTTDAEKARFREPSDYRVELREKPSKFYGETLRLADKDLLMIDRITGYWPEGGKAGLGRMRSEKDSHPGQWFFKLHFYEDPVQPGSLGLEAMIQLLQAYALERGLGDGFAKPRFQSIATGVEFSWKYRGQVPPTARVMSVDLDVTSVVREANAVLITADCSLWVDGKRIYEALNLPMRIVEGG